MNALQVRIIMNLAPPVAYVLKIHLAHTVKALHAKLVFIMSSQRQMVQKHVSNVLLASNCQEYWDIENASSVQSATSPFLEKDAQRVLQAHTQTLRSQSVLPVEKESGVLLVVLTIFHFVSTAQPGPTPLPLEWHLNLDATIVLPVNSLI